MPRRAHLSRHAARHLDAAAAAGDLRHLAARRHDSTSRPAASSPARLERGAAGSAAGAVHLRHRQGGADAGAPLAAGGHGRADAGQRAAACGGGGQGRRVHRSSRSSSTSSASRRWRSSGAATGSSAVAGFTIIAASVVALRQDNLKRRLAYSTVSQLSYVVLAAAHPGAALDHRRRAAHRRARRGQDHAVLRRRRDLHGRAQDRGQPSSTASAGACRGRWAPSRSARCRMIGLPPTAGFLGKWFMLSGAMQTRAVAAGRRDRR